MIRRPTARPPVRRCRTPPTDTRRHDRRPLGPGRTGAGAGSAGRHGPALYRLGLVSCEPRQAGSNLRRLRRVRGRTHQEHRRFLGRAVRFVAGQGIRQFLDLGAGFPSQGNVHEVAGQVSPDAHVVYIDDDPVLINHASALLVTDRSITAVIQSDLRVAGKVYADSDLYSVIEFALVDRYPFVSFRARVPVSAAVCIVPGISSRRCLAAISSCPTSPVRTI